MQFHAWLLTQLWFTNLLPSLIAWWWVGPKTKCRLPTQCVSEGWRFTNRVFVRAHRGPVSCALDCDRHLVVWFVSYHLSQLTTKPTKRCAPREDSEQPESLLCAQQVAKDPSFLHVDSEDSDQPGRMPKLICLRWAHMPFCGFCHALAHLWLCAFHCDVVLIRFTEHVSNLELHQN